MLRPAVRSLRMLRIIVKMTNSNTPRLHNHHGEHRPAACAHLGPPLLDRCATVFPNKDQGARPTGSRRCASGTASKEGQPRPFGPRGDRRATGDVADLPIPELVVPPDGDTRHQASELGLRLNVDHLIEPENFENHAHPMCGGDDDQPSTQPFDSLVDVHYPLGSGRVHKCQSAHVKPEFLGLPVEGLTYGLFKGWRTTDVELARDGESFRRPVLTELEPRDCPSSHQPTPEGAAMCVDEWESCPSGASVLCAPCP